MALSFRVKIAQCRSFVSFAVRMAQAIDNTTSPCLGKIPRS
jgi:hypothetical protein